MSEDLDESRRHGVPLDPHPPPHPHHLSTVNENRSLTNGWHPPNGGGGSDEFSLQQQQQQSPPPFHAPQHLQEHQTRSPIITQPDQIHESSSTSRTTAKDLDGELSGLQAAAAKTALLIHGKPKRNSLDGDTVVEEDDEDHSSHWIFRKHVEFSQHLTEPILHRPPPSRVVSHSGHDNMNGHSNNYIYQQHRSVSSPAIIEDSTLTKDSDTDDQTEKSKLIQQLHSLRNQRRQLQQTTQTTLHQHLHEWNLHLSSSQHSYQNNALSTLASISAKRISTEEQYQLICKWHVLGDVFFIWHRGPFGTINGFRLGKSVVTMAGLVKKCHAGGGSQGQPSSGGGGMFSWGGASETANNKTTANISQTAQTTINTNNINFNSTANNNPRNNAIAAAITHPEKITIPWTEINSALGQIVFLLYTLQHVPYSGISFRKHVLQPCGSASKIGVLKKAQHHQHNQQHPRSSERRRITALAAYNSNNDTFYDAKATKGAAATPQPSSLHHQQQKQPPPTPLPGDVTWYNLHHYEENGSLLSMGYYARRNFNTALEGLVFCVAEACAVVERRDMALSAPYVMCVGGLVVGKDALSQGAATDGGIDGGAGGVKKDGEATVGGLPIAYDPVGNAGERWTLVCKYLLTNLKWLIAYAAKHVDR